MNNDAGKAKSNGLLKTVLFVFIYVILMSAATAATLSSSGIFRTLPLIFVIPAAATLFYNKKRLTLALTFVFVLVFSMMENGSLFEAVVTALVAAAFCGAGILAKRLIITFFADKASRKISLPLFVVLIVAGIALYAFLFGNPFSALSAQKRNAEYISSTYNEAAPETEYVHYDFAEKTYFTRVSFREDAVMSADIAKKSDGTVIDGYNNYYEYKYLEARRLVLTALLEMKIPDETRAIRSNIFRTDIPLAALSQDPDSLCEYMVFDIAFYGQILNDYDFAAKCKQYDNAIRENGFDHLKINYYGGFADEFVYEMTVEKDTDADLSTLVKPFSDETFERYYDEEDLYDHWSYND